MKTLRFIKNCGYMKRSGLFAVCILIPAALAVFMFGERYDTIKEIFEKGVDSGNAAMIYSDPDAAMNIESFFDMILPAAVGGMSVFWIGCLTELFGISLAMQVPRRIMKRAFIILMILAEMLMFAASFLSCAAGVLILRLLYSSYEYKGQTIDIMRLADLGIDKMLVIKLLIIIMFFVFLADIYLIGTKLGLFKTIGLVFSTAVVVIIATVGLTEVRDHLLPQLNVLATVLTALAVTLLIVFWETVDKWSLEDKVFI